MAVVIVIVTLVSANHNVTTPPTFQVQTGIEDGKGPVTFPVACHATGPGALDAATGGSSGVDLYGDEFWKYPNTLHEGMSNDDYETYVEDWKKATGTANSDDPAQTEAFLQTIRDNTEYYCAQLRENQQTGLVLIFGRSVLFLLLIGFGAVLVGGRRKNTIEG